MTKEAGKLLYSIGIDPIGLYCETTSISEIGDIPEARVILTMLKSDTGTIDKTILKNRVTDEFEAIGILTNERKQQKDKEAFLNATTEQRTIILAKRLNLK